MNIYESPTYEIDISVRANIVHYLNSNYDYK
jgi:hypothetical protein